MTNHFKTKRQFDAYIRQMIFSELDGFGFSNKNGDFVWENDIFTFDILISYWACKGSDGIELRFHCYLTLKSVNQFLYSLNQREFSMATFRFPLEVSQSSSIHAQSHYFYMDNEKNNLDKIQKIVLFIKNIIKHFDKIQGVEILTEKGIRKLPFLFKHYKNGLMADFQFCLPPIAVIGQALDGNHQKALACLKIDNILSDFEKETLKTLIECGEVNRIFNVPA